MNWRLLATVAFMLACSVECTSPLDPKPLRRFSDCDEMSRFVEDRVLAASRSQSLFIPFWGCASPAAAGEGEGEGDRVANEATDDAGGAKGAGSRTFTQTNTQEVDVDEPDLVKNDGDTLFIVSGHDLVIVDAWPADSLNVRSVTPFADSLDGLQSRNMLLADGRALVFSDSFTWDENSEYGNQRTTITLFDISDLDDPRVLRTTTIDGQYLDARRVGDEVSVVTTSYLETWSLELDQRWFRDDENRARVAREIDRVFPQVHDAIAGTDATTTQAAACTDSYGSESTTSDEVVGVLVVTTMSLKNEKAPVRSTAVIGNFAFVYASTQSVWLANFEQHDGGFFTPPFTTTRVHHLSAFQGNGGDTGAADYKASGLFYGTVKDELSLDEEGGLLRMVITDDGADTDFEARKTALLVVEEDGDQLTEIARVDNLGQGEDVQAVRFLGDRAYVVTFPTFAEELIDPLFVIDMKNPREPELAGELEVRGYSTYIHPLDEDHILTIGQDVDPNSGAFLSLQLEIFDVSNAKKPKLAHREPFGNTGTSSDALFDRHAFTYFAEQKLLALPMTQWSEGDYFTGTAVFSIDVEAGIAPVGTLDLTDLFQDAGAWSFNCAVARRSVMIADEEEGTFVYSISSGAVASARIDGDTVTRVGGTSLTSDPESVGCSDVFFEDEF